MIDIIKVIYVTSLWLFWVFARFIHQIYTEILKRFFKVRNMVWLKSSFRHLTASLRLALLRRFLNFLFFLYMPFLRLTIVLDAEFRRVFDQSILFQLKLLQNISIELFSSLLLLSCLKYLSILFQFLLKDKKIFLKLRVTELKLLCATLNEIPDEICLLNGHSNNFGLHSRYNC